MRDNLPNMLRAAAKEWQKENKVVATGKTRYDFALEEAADAIEELSEKRDAACWGCKCEKIEPTVWIPVTERLPEEMDQSCGGWSAEIRPSDDVLVWLSPEKRQSVAWYSHTYNEWTTVDENTVYYYEEITHWMPLPQPPKKNGKSET